MSVCPDRSERRRSAGPNEGARSQRRRRAYRPLEQPHDLHRVRQRVKVVVPHVTLATAALVVARVAEKFCRCGVQLERVASPSTLPPPPMLLTSSQPMPPLLPPSSPALSRFLLLMCSCLLRCVQLMALPRWLVGRFRPLCTNVLAAARRASCLRGLAGGLFAFVSILLEVIVEKGSSSEVRPRQVEPIRCTRAAAECPACERADGQPVRADLARFFLAHAGTAGAFDKGDFRVRAPGGVVVSPLARARRAVRAWLHVHDAMTMRVTA